MSGKYPNSNRVKQMEDRGDELVLSEEKSVSQRDGIVYRPSGPWSHHVHHFLRHLKANGFDCAPDVAGTGFDAKGRETLYFVEGEFVHPKPWSDQGLVAVGQLLRKLHDTAQTYVPADDAQWQPWFLRELGEGRRIISHGDIAPWNTVTQDGMPIALIDWEFAGPVDPMTELARVCWLFVQMHGEDVDQQVGLPELAVRARQLKLLVDAYEPPQEWKGSLVERIIDVAVLETAEQAVEINVTPESEGALWGIAWRSRAAAWMIRNRSTLIKALL